MACEVSVERALSAAFASKNLQYLKDPVLDFLNGYSLSNDKNRVTTQVSTSRPDVLLSKAGLRRRALECQGKSVEEIVALLV